MENNGGNRNALSNVFSKVLNVFGSSPTLTENDLLAMGRMSKKPVRLILYKDGGGYIETALSHVDEVGEELFDFGTMSELTRHLRALAQRGTETETEAA